jgi:hypothetical protein
MSRQRIRISQVLILNTLCAIIGQLLAFNAWYIWRYWHVITRLPQELWQWLSAVVSH